MATTLTHLETVRRVLRGFSGPQPLAGTAQRAADAYAAMMAAEWTESDDGPAVPPHHFDRASPMPGDAYRQTWGYDKSTRTERSACGAVCYTVRLPADALGGEACGVASVSAKVFGDRYLECGAILTAILSEDAVPPAWGAILADGASTSAILVPAATDAHGDMIEPNKRADTSATATLPVGAPAAAWLHLVLRVADYLAVRDAWHEGGAMLDPESVSVTFSRDVVADAPPAYPLFWRPPAPDSSLEHNSWYDESAAFAIAVPHAMWRRCRGYGLNSQFTDAWDASLSDVRELLDGLRWPVATGYYTLYDDAPAGHAVLPYGVPTRSVYTAASGVTDTIWAGFKLVTRKMTNSNPASYSTFPEQHAAAAIYPVTGMRRMTFGALVAPAVSLAAPMSLRLLAYRVAGRPPLPTDSGNYGHGPVTGYASFNYGLPCSCPIVSSLDCPKLFFGKGASLAFVDEITEFEWSPLGNQGGTSYPSTDIPISPLGSWEIGAPVAAGAEFKFDAPLDVDDGYAGLLLIAVPTGYAPVSASEDIYVDWPLSGWSLI